MAIGGICRRKAREVIGAVAAVKGPVSVGVLDLLAMAVVVGVIIWMAVVVGVIIWVTVNGEVVIGREPFIFV